MNDDDITYALILTDSPRYICSVCWFITSRLEDEKWPMCCDNFMSIIFRDDEE